jgi:hypothetical protein
VVISRGYAMIVLILFTIFSLYYVYMRPSIFQPTTPFEAPKDSRKISTTWEEFLQDCGGEVVVENNVHARNIFNHKYEQNEVSWKGYFADTKQSSGNPLPFVQSDHAINILVKMMPSESVLYPDIVLSVSSKYLAENQALIKSLEKGDEIVFDAKIMTLGNEFKMHHLHLLNFEKTGNSVPLNDIVVRESTLP